MATRSAIVSLFLSFGSNLLFLVKILSVVFKWGASLVLIGSRFVAVVVASWLRCDNDSLVARPSTCCDQIEEKSLVGCRLAGWLTEVSGAPELNWFSQKSSPLTVIWPRPILIVVKLDELASSQVSAKLSEAVNYN